MNQFAYFPAFLVATLCLSHSALGADWPQWRGPNRDGISAEKGWQTAWSAEGPKRLWEQKVGAGYSSMSVSEGRVYTMGNTNDVDLVSCFNAETGAPVWQHAYACLAKDPNGFQGTRGTPTIDQDRVYTVSRHGHLFCLDAKTGKVKWTKNLVKDLAGREPMHSGGKNEGWGFAGSPLIEKQLVLVEAGGDGSSVVALNKLTGEPAWKTGTDQAGYASLMALDVEGQRCFFQFAGEDLILRRMKDGSELWRYPWKTSYGVNSATPIIHDHHVFISSGYGFGCALGKISLKGFEEVWRNKNMKNHVNSCVLVDGYLYGFDEGELKCVDWKTGEVKWGHRSYGKGSLIFSDGKLLLYGDKGKLGLAEATSAGFKELASFQALTGQNTWAHPVLANGRIYARNLDTLAAFDVKK
jgi:outer membrane protein assembly factor BamB